MPQGQFRLSDVQAPEKPATTTGQFKLSDILMPSASAVATPLPEKAILKPTHPGLLTEGNVDLFAQPKVTNPDGGTSTVFSKSFNLDGHEVLLPSVTPDGRFLATDDDVVAEYGKTGRHLGVFDTPENATAYATQLHEDYAAGKYEKPVKGRTGKIELGSRSTDLYRSAKKALADIVDGALTPLIPESFVTSAVQTMENLQQGAERETIKQGKDPSVAGARARGAAQGVVEGGRSVVRGLSSPLNLGLEAMGVTEGVVLKAVQRNLTSLLGLRDALVTAKAAKDGEAAIEITKELVATVDRIKHLETAQAVMRGTQAATGAAFSAEGIVHAVQAPTFSEKALGVAAAAGGAAMVAAGVPGARTAAREARESAGFAAAGREGLGKVTEARTATAAPPDGDVVAQPPAGLLTGEVERPALAGPARRSPAPTAPTGEFKIADVATVTPAPASATPAPALSAVPPSTAASPAGESLKTAPGRTVVSEMSDTQLADEFSEGAMVLGRLKGRPDYGARLARHRQVANEITRRFKETNAGPLGEQPQAQEVRNGQHKAEAAQEPPPITGRPVGPEAVDVSPPKKERDEHSFSSTQVNLPKEHADAIVAMARAIPDADIAEDGRAGDSVGSAPHVTVKYGLHTTDVKKVAKVLKDEPPITVTLGATSLFSNDDADVLKIDIDSADLHRLNKKIAGALDVTDTYPDYKPHLTIAYLKPGKGKDYEGDESLKGHTITLDHLTFSAKDGKIYEIPLTGTNAQLGSKLPRTPATPQVEAMPGTAVRLPSFATAQYAKPGEGKSGTLTRDQASTEDAEMLADLTRRLPDVSDEELAGILSDNRERQRTAPGISKEPGHLDLFDRVEDAVLQETQKRGLEAPKALQRPVRTIDVEPIAAHTEEAQAREASPADRPIRLFEAFKALVQENTLPKDTRELRKLAKSLVGGDPTTYTDDITDAIEAALTANVASGDVAFRTRLADAQDLESRLPRAHRSLEKTELQQFSTPLPLAVAAQHAADLRTGDAVLEPTAGTGHLIATLDPKARTVVASELSPRRASLLKALGYDVIEGDYLQNLQMKESADVIITNPPWGKYSTGKYGKPIGLKFTPGDVAERFIAKNVRDLKDGGRLVAVMPTTMLGPSGAMFRKYLKGAGQVVALVKSPPGSYRTRSTDVDSVLLVWDKGATGEHASLVEPADWEAYATSIEAIAPRKGVDAQPERPAEQPAVGRPSAVTGGGAGSRRGDGRRPAERGQSGLPGERGTPVLPAGRDTDVVAPESGGERRGLEPQRAAARVAAPASGESTRGLSPNGRDAYRRAQDSLFFAPYRLRSAIAGVRHPKLVVEARNLAGIDYPALTLAPTERVRKLVEAGRASIEQAEQAMAVVQANIDGHHGYLAADNVGVGKSREIALTLLDLMERAKADKRPLRLLVTTKSADNVNDLLREMKEAVLEGEDPGFEIVRVADLKASKVKSADNKFEPLPQYEHAIYVTDFYNLAPYRAALQEVGLHGIIGDEAHRFKNADAAVGGTWQTLHAAIMLRQPRDQQVFGYFSATPAQSVYDYQYLYGLRLWPIDGFQAWVEVVTGQASAADAATLEAATEAGAIKAAAVQAANGEAVVGGDSEDSEQAVRSRNAGEDVFASHLTPSEAEQIPREWKMLGRFSARDLWREGTEFQVHTAQLPEEAKARYDTFATLARDVIDAAAKFGKADKSGRSNRFGPKAALQAAAKRIQMQPALEEAIRMAQAGIEEGHQVVLSLINVSEMDPNEGNIAAAINQINTREVEKTDEGYEDVGEIPEALIRRAELLEQAQAIGTLPDPIEMIAEAFGREDVAFIVGASAGTRQAQAKEFQEGKRKVAVISAAGSTGISLDHRTFTKKGVRGRRLFIDVQYEWSASEAVQRYGRVDRAAQLTAPKILALNFGSASEKKFLATVANRMASLGALSKGGAESTGANALEEFEITGNDALIAARNAWAAQDESDRELWKGKPFTDPNHPERPARMTRATMREINLALLWLPTDRANAFWEAFIAERARIREQMGYATEAKTKALRGEVLRSTEIASDLTLYEVKNEAGHRFGILQGVVMGKMPRLRTHLYDADGRIQRSYINFTAGDRVISGLEIPWTRIKGVAAEFGASVQGEAIRTPEQARTALKAGDTITLGHRSEGSARPWQLRQRKDEKILIDGAKMADRALLLRHGGDYSPVGNFWHVVNLEKFLERFPVANEPTTAQAPPSEATTPEPSQQTRPSTSSEQKTWKANAEFIQKQIGPRRVGGRYRNAYSGTEYTVTAIKRDNETGEWSITIKDDKGERTHRTAWDRKDLVVSQPEEGGTTLGMAVIPGAKEFLEGDVVPTLAKAAAELQDARRSLRTIFAPDTVSRPAATMAGIMRANLAASWQRAQRARKVMAGASKALDKLYAGAARGDAAAIEKFLIFTDAMEGTGDLANLTPAERDVAEWARSVLDAKRAEVQKHGRLADYLEHYFPHEWAKPSLAAQALRRLFGKRPLQGPASFLKQRKIPTVREGIEAGLTPVTWNPIELVLRKLFEMDKWITAKQILKEGKEAELAVYVRVGQKPTDGMVAYPESMGTVYGPRSEIGMMTIAGRYYGPVDAVRIIGNYLSPGLRGKSALFDLYRNAGNFLNQIQLSLSAFHAMTTGLESIVSKQALALEYLTRGNLTGAIKAQVQVPVSIAVDLVKGHKALQAFYAKDANARAITDIIDQIVQAGGGFGWDLFEHTGAPARFMEALRQGNYPGAALRLIPAAIEMQAKPIMDWWVPRLKMAAFLDRAALELESLGPNPDLEEVRHVLGNAWDSIDNRFGELRYDNLFWHNLLKDVGMASTRALGWNLGSLREMGGAYGGQLARLGLLPSAGGRGGFGKRPQRLVNVGKEKGKKGKPIYQEQPAPWLHPKMAWFLSMVMIAGTLGAIYQYLHTGERPREIKDLFFPKNGRKNADGSDQRVSLPGYMKDLYSWLKQPLTTALHKANPLLTMLWETVQNQDYFGVELRHKGDPIVEQVQDYFAYLYEVYRPISLTKTTDDSSAENLFGINRAPGYVTRTDAEEALREIQDRRGRPTLTREQGDARAARGALRRGLAAGTVEGRAEAAEAVRSGLLTRRQVRRGAQDAGRSYLQRGFQTLSLEEAVHVYEVATPEERRALFTALNQKVRRFSRSSPGAAATLARFGKAVRLPRSGTAATSVK